MVAIGCSRLAFGFFHHSVSTELLTCILLSPKALWHNCRWVSDGGRIFLAIGNPNSGYLFTPLSVIGKLALARMSGLRREFNCFGWRSWPAWHMRVDAVGLGGL